MGRHRVGKNKVKHMDEKSDAVDCCENIQNA
jgi:hypothetical protein